MHRVKLLPGTKPVSVKSQKRWPAHTEWWLQKLIDDGIKGGIYEHTITANGRLSEWNSRAVLVDKIPNPTPVDEPRLTFAYHQVKSSYLVYTWNLAQSYITVLLTHVMVVYFGQSQARILWNFPTS